MPTSLSAFATGETTMRYKEPYVTEGLNKKHAVNTPPGTYRGFRLGIGPAVNITVTADPTFFDHVAVYQTASGASLTIRKTGGDFLLNLAAFASKTVVIAIYATYGVGFTTTAEIRAYELSPTDEYTGAVENAELVVLGTVVVPAMGSIPAANITYDRRRMSWEAVAPEAFPWQPLLQNSSFEENSGGDSGDSLVDVAQFWEASITAGTAVWKSGPTGNARTGFAKVTLERLGAGVVTGRLLQRVGVPVVPGQLIRMQAYKRSLEASTAGSLRFVLKFWGQNRIANAEVTSTITSNVADAGYVLAEATIAVPDLTGGVATGYLEFVGIEALTIDYAVASSEKIRFDDFQAWLEVRPNTATPDILKTVGAYQLFLKGITGNYGGSQALVRMGASQALEVLAADPTSGQPTLTPYGRIVVGQGLLSSESDALQPRVTAAVSVTGGVDYTLLWESARVGEGVGTYTQPVYRRYAAPTGQIIETLNARYDGTNWNKDVSGQAATQRIQTGSKVQFFFRPNDLNAAWSVWAQAHEFNGPETVTTANPDFPPWFTLFDSVGNRRVAFDHLGFTNGHVRRFELDFQYISPTIGVGGGGFGSVSYGNYLNGPGASLNIQNNNDQAYFENGYHFSTPVHANHLSVLEWEILTSDLTGTPSITLEMGWKHDQSLPSTEDYVKFSKTSASASWQFMTRSTALTFTQDTGVAVATGVPQRFRIEWYGSGHPGGARALGFIDGVLVGENNDATRLPDGDPMPISVIFMATAGLGSIKNVRISPFVFQHRRLLVDDAT